MLWQSRVYVFRSILIGSGAHRGCLSRREHCRVFGCPSNFTPVYKTKQIVFLCMFYSEAFETTTSSVGWV